MQENRAFDHYYGIMKGVRVRQPSHLFFSAGHAAPKPHNPAHAPTQGYNDRASHVLPSGLPAFYQPLSVTNTSD